MSLSVEGVTKRFGAECAVENLSFTARSGEPFALLGSNGAGKTTTIRMILGLYPVDQGHIRWNGERLTRKRVKIGYLPEERGLYPKSTVIEQLTYFGVLRDMSARAAVTSAESLLERLQMIEHKGKRVEELSKGNQQKIQLAATLINDPDLIILDEPFSGLDPLNAEMLRDVVTNYAKKGRVILFSSHQMDSVENLCRDMVILRQGKTMVRGTIRDVKKAYGRTRLLVTAEEDVVTRLRVDGVVSIEQAANGIHLTLTDEAVALRVFKILANHNVFVSRFELQEPTLREIFIEKVGGGT